MILELVPPGSDVLRTPSEPFDFSDPPIDPLELARDLQETMVHHSGLGLSAVQCGMLLRVFSLRSDPDATLFNPRIVDTSEEEVELDEGCLSFAGLFLKRTRPRLVRVRFQLPDGETRTLKLSGITARVVLHEMDHLDGRLFFNGLSRLRRSRLIRKTELTMRDVRD